MTSAGYPNDRRTSAILAILFPEPYAEHYAKAITTASSRRMSVATLVEAPIVLESRGGAAAGYALDAFLEEAESELEPVTPEQAQAARRAWQRFGKGNGDCFAYALAQAKWESLLFKVRDFTLTDVEVA
jgi:ribonuclease VapC